MTEEECPGITNPFVKVYRSGGGINGKVRCDVAKSNSHLLHPVLKLKKV
jgi:hypothetical protein